jgi:hypothetical protein
MPDNTPLDDMLLPLADAYEVRRNRTVLVEAWSVEEPEPLREFLAQQVSDDLMTYWVLAGQPEMSPSQTRDTRRTYREFGRCEHSPRRQTKCQ